MAIESHLPSRENSSPAQSQRDATSAPQTAPGHFEARETDTDVPNKEIAKPAITVIAQDGKPVPEPEAPIRSPQKEPDPELEIPGDDAKTNVGSGY